MTKLTSEAMFEEAARKMNAHLEGVMADLVEELVKDLQIFDQAEPSEEMYQAMELVAEETARRWLQRHQLDLDPKLVAKNVIEAGRRDLGR